MLTVSAYLNNLGMNGVHVTSAWMNRLEDYNYIIIIMY